MTNFEFNDVERWPDSIRKKNTSRWCKGRPGINHRFQEAEYVKFTVWTWYIDKCTVCGKHGRVVTRESEN